VTWLELAVCRYALPLRRPLVTAVGTHTAREGYVVRLRQADGTTGFGEAAPLPGRGTEPLDAVPAALRRLSAALAALLDGAESVLPQVPEELRRLAGRLAAAVPDAPAARAALDLALADLAARRAGLPLACWWRSNARREVPVNAVVGAEAPGEAARQALEAVGRGFRTLKLKVGSGGRADRLRLAAVREAVGVEVALRIDANGGRLVEQE